MSDSRGGSAGTADDGSNPVAHEIDGDFPRRRHLLSAASVTSAGIRPSARRGGEHPAFRAFRARLRAHAAALEGVERRIELDAAEFQSAAAGVAPLAIVEGTLYSPERSAADGALDWIDDLREVAKGLRADALRDFRREVEEPAEGDRTVLPRRALLEELAKSSAAFRKAAVGPTAFALATPSA